MEKHKHYTAIRAFADGWGIEVLRHYSHEWVQIDDPSFSLMCEYRIVPDEDGWLPWYGGECPVPEGTRIEIRFSDNTISSRLSNATSLKWSHKRLPGDIFAYRVVEEAKLKKKVKLWQFVYKRKGPPHITACFYPTLEDAVKGCGGDIIIQRADWTEIEVEES